MSHQVSLTELLLLVLKPTLVSTGMAEAYFPLDYPADAGARKEQGLSVRDMDAA